MSPIQIHRQKQLELDELEDEPVDDDDEDEVDDELDEEELDADELLLDEPLDSPLLLLLVPDEDDWPDELPPLFLHLPLLPPPQHGQLSLFSQLLHSPSAILESS